MNKKNKFIENNNNKLNKQPYYEQINNNNCIHNIIKDNYNSKTKSALELTDNLNPYNYNLSYENKIKKDLKGEESFIYYSPYNQGPGRGFGNLHINNMIRKSESSRYDNEDFKLFRESEIYNRFDFLDNRFSNPNNLVFPFPRSGENTRKVANTLLENSQNINEYNFNKPNKIKISNENTKIANENTKIANENTKIVNENNQPNKQIIDSINYTNNQQKIRQEKYKELQIELQNKINQLKIKYGPKLTRQIIVKELNLKNDPNVDEFLQIELDNIKFNEKSINYSLPETVKIDKPTGYSEIPLNYSRQLELDNINFNNKSINYSFPETINIKKPSDYSDEPLIYSKQLELDNINFNDKLINYDFEKNN